VGLHFDVSDSFNYSGTTKVISDFNAAVYVFNDSYYIADAELTGLAVRSAATDVSSSGICP